MHTHVNGLVEMVYGSWLPPSTMRVLRPKLRLSLAVKYLYLLSHLAGLTVLSSQKLKAKGLQMPLSGQIPGCDPQHSIHGLVASACNLSPGGGPGDPVSRHNKGEMAGRIRCFAPQARGSPEPT